jgi:hypothetical protein
VIRACDAAREILDHRTGAVSDMTADAEERDIAAQAITMD